MEVHIEIEDGQIQSMSEGAQETLKTQLLTYAINIIKEANLIEEGNREDGANQEITSNIVLQAVRKYKNNTPKKRNKGLIGLKIASAFSLLVTGFLFDENGYQDNIVKMILFIIVLIIACITTILQIVKED